MTVRIRQTCDGVDWAAVSALLKAAGMASFLPEQHAQAFSASYAAVFVYDDGRLIGCGRLLCDGVYQAALYDVAVSPDCQGRGIGRRIVETLLSRAQRFNVVLYASPGKESFYRKLGFRVLKTGMVRFVHADAMAQKGFSD